MAALLPLPCWTGASRSQRLAGHLPLPFPHRGESGRCSDMRDQAAKNWRRVRVTRSRTESTSGAILPPNRGNLVGELPGPDGIRWGLVNRVRAESAAGLYEREEKLACAEERLRMRLCWRK